MTPHPITVSDWRQAYRDGASPVALLGASIERLQEVPGAVIRSCTAGELARRLALLERSARDSREALPLYGVPFAVKDNIDLAGVPTTAACPAFAYTPRESAQVVLRLEAAGAVCIAKTNLDQFATGLAGTRSPYGRPASVHAPDRISGGSSSGSAVLVGRGVVAFALGTDTAGSGRVPAGFNQIVGLKPTPGRVGTRGVLPACRTLDCVSVFSQTVDDAAAVLAVVEGHDEADPFSLESVGPAALPARLRVGVPRAPFFFGDAGYEQAWRQPLSRLQALGHTTVPIDTQALDDIAALLYDGPWVAERHVVVQQLLERDPSALDDSVRRIIERARTYSATQAFEAQYRLRELARQAGRLWSDCDVLMVPTAPGHPRFEEVDADPIGVNTLLGRYTNFVNLLGWCALAVPAARTAQGLPFGVTFIARRDNDAALAQLGRRWQAGLGLPMGATGVLPEASTRQPLHWPRSEPVLPIAVVGAHLSGLPLNHQLVERGATLIEATTTAPHYRLHALPGTAPPKPGLVRDEQNGTAIALEVWAMPEYRVGSFLASIAAPLGLGSIELADGRTVHGFLCEAHAAAHAPDVSRHGGWRAYLASLH